MDYKDRFKDAQKMLNSSTKQFKDVMDNMDEMIVKIGVDSDEAKRFRSFKKEIYQGLKNKDKAELTKLVGRINGTTGTR